MNLLRQITSKIRESNFEFLQDSSILKNEKRQKLILEIFIAFIVVGFCSLWLFNTVAYIGIKSGLIEGVTCGSIAGVMNAPLLMGMFFSYKIMRI